MMTMMRLILTEKEAHETESRAVGKTSEEIIRDAVFYGLKIKALQVNKVLSV